MINPDSLGIVASFACDSALEARTFGAVCTRWQQAFRESTELWESLSAQRWPGRRGGAVARSHDRFKALVLAELRLRPLTRSELNPIEHCDFVFRCPQYADVLSEAGELDEAGRPVLHCSVCDRHVYMVDTQEELDRCAGLRRCVVFKRRLKRDADTQRPVDVVLLDGSADGAIGVTALATLLHTSITDYPADIIPSTLHEGRELILQHVGQLTMHVRVIRVPAYESDPTLTAIVAAAPVAVNLTPGTVRVEVAPPPSVLHRVASVFSSKPPKQPGEVRMKAGTMVAPTWMGLSELVTWMRQLYQMDGDGIEMGDIAP